MAVAAEAATVAIAETERAVETLDEGIEETVAESLAAKRRAQQPAFAECAEKRCQKRMALT